MDETTPPVTKMYLTGYSRRERCGEGAAGKRTGIGSGEAANVLMNATFGEVRIAARRRRERPE
jgi:hypothetical protein